MKIPVSRAISVLITSSLLALVLFFFFFADSMDSPLIHGSLPSTCFILMIFQDTVSPWYRDYQHPCRSCNNFSFVLENSSQDSCILQEKKEKGPDKKDLSSTAVSDGAFFLSIDVDACNVETFQYAKWASSCCRSGRSLSASVAL